MRRLTTALLAAAWWLNFRYGVMKFRPGWVGTILCVAILGTFYAQHVARLGWLPMIVLPAVLSAALVPLWRHRQRQPPATATLGNRLVTTNLPWLGLMPLAATAVYAAARPLGLDRMPIASVVYYWITGPAGLLFMVVAMIQCLRGRRSSPVVSSLK